MPNQSERRKARKFYRAPSGETRMTFFKEKASKKTCGLCGETLHGVLHGKRKTQVLQLSKSQRRPSVLFGGVLCSSCRTEIIEEAVKVKTGLKNLSEVGFVERKFVEMAMNKVGE